MSNPNPFNYISIISLSNNLHVLSSQSLCLPIFLSILLPLSLLSRYSFIHVSSPYPTFSFLTFLFHICIFLTGLLVFFHLSRLEYRQNTFLLVFLTNYITFSKTPGNSIWLESVFFPILPSLMCTRLSLLPPSFASYSLFS